jgi:hypothetical protein
MAENKKSCGQGSSSRALPSKGKLLSSNPSTTKKKKKKKKKQKEKLWEVINASGVCKPPGDSDGHSSVTTVG